MKRYWSNIGTESVGQGASFVWAGEAPTGLTATVISDTRIDLTWTNVDTTGTGVSIERSSDNGSTFSEVYTVALGVATKADTSCSPSTFYIYRIRAYKGSQYSSYTSNAYARTNDPSILTDGNTIAKWDAYQTAGVVRDADGLDGRYYDLMTGIAGRGAELATGDTLPWGLYEITATQANYFYTGCQIGDVFSLSAAKTLSANNKVKKVLGNHLTLESTVNKPVYGLFDGSDDYLKLNAITLNQPEMIYMIFRQVGWSSGKRIFDGNAANSGIVFQTSGGASPQLSFNAASSVGPTTDAVLGSFVVLRQKFNGASSFMKVNATSSLSGNSGTNNMSGFTLGAGGGGTNASRIQFVKAIVRAVDESSANEATIYNSMKAILDSMDLNLVFDGDSLTAGGTTPGHQCYPTKVLTYYQAKNRYVPFASYGVGGQTILNMISDMATQIVPLASNLANDVIVAWEDVNSILNGGRTAQQQYDDMVTYFTACSGFNRRIIITSPYPRKVSGSYPAGWTAEVLQAQKDYFDLVKNAVSPPWTDHIDLRDAEHIGGAEGQEHDPTYYIAGNWVHLTDAGYAIVAEKVEAKIDAYLNY